MSFQDEMKQIFLRVAAGEVEPKEWEVWWNSHSLKLKEAFNRGDRGRMSICSAYGICWLERKRKDMHACKNA